jgi:hypothetical protein
MPNAEKYARYRADQTTIWVSKTAAGFLSREKERPGEGAGAVLDRLLGELRRLRRAQGPATKSAGAKSTGGRAGGASASGAKRAGAKVATRSKVGTRSKVAASRSRR